MKTSDLLDEQLRQSQVFQPKGPACLSDYVNFPEQSACSIIGRQDLRSVGEDIYITHGTTYVDDYTLDPKLLFESDNVLAAIQYGELTIWTSVHALEAFIEGSPEHRVGTGPNGGTTPGFEPMNPIEPVPRFSQRPDLISVQDVIVVASSLHWCSLPHWISSRFNS